MWITLLLGAVVGLGIGAMLANVLHHKKALPLALLGAVAGGILAYTYASGGVNFPEVASAEQFHQQVLQADGPVVVDFYTDSCIACRKLAPTMESLAGRYTGKVTFLKVNVGRSADLGRQYEIEAVPTVMLFVGGEIRQRWVGAMPAEQYAKALDEVITNQ